MEIRVYRNLSQFTDGKPLYCSKVECPECFSFENALSLFKSIYGVGITVVFVCV